MNTQHARQLSRRRFLSRLTLAGTAGLLGLPRRSVAAEPPPETPRLKVVQLSSICTAPNHVAEELLKAEGFAEVEYLQKTGGLVSKTLGAGEADIALNFAGPLVISVDSGNPIVILAGIHSGCFQLVGTQRVQTIRDLKGKTVNVIVLGGIQHVFLASMVAYVGLDPRSDITWGTHPAAEQVPLLQEGKIDAFVAFPPLVQELRAKQIGHVVVDSTSDRPWSQYFCCMVEANRDFIRQYPVATKRALRALLKAANLCALEPERVAQQLVDKGLAKDFGYALQAMKELPYDTWHSYNPEDTVRFYALRLHEVGMIKSSPQKIIAQGTDWRFFNALKKELKG